MSQTVWNILSVLTILASFLLFWDYPEQLATLSPDRHFQFIVGGVFFASLLGAIACMCFFPQSRPVTLRILGVIGISGCVFIVVEGFKQRDFSQYPIVLVFWLPGSIYLVLSGKMNSDK